MGTATNRHRPQPQLEALQANSTRRPTPDGGTADTPQTRIGPQTLDLRQLSPELDRYLNLRELQTEQATTSEDQQTAQQPPYNAEAWEVEHAPTSSEDDDDEPDRAEQTTHHLTKPCGTGFHAFAMTAHWSSVHVADVEHEDVKPCRTRCGISLGAKPILLESLEGRTLCRRAACKRFLEQIV